MQHSVTTTDTEMRQRVCKCMFSNLFYPRQFSNSQYHWHRRASVWSIDCCTRCMCTAWKLFFASALLDSEEWLGETGRLFFILLLPPPQPPTHHPLFSQGKLQPVPRKGNLGLLSIQNGTFLSFKQQQTFYIFFFLYARLLQYILFLDAR